MKKRFTLLSALLMLLILSTVVPAQAATKRQVACQAYRSMLKKIITTGTIRYEWGDEKVTQKCTPSSYSFFLNDLNSDGIPELFLSGSYRGYRTAGFTYYGGHIYQFYLDRYLLSKFAGNKKVFLERSDPRGKVYYSCYLLNKGRMQNVADWSVYSNRYYDEKGNEITKKQYYTILGKYGVTASTKVLGQPGSKQLTKENVIKYIR